MENDKAASKSIEILPVEGTGQERDGKNFVDGWRSKEWDSFEEYVQEGFDQETTIHPSFNSIQEALKFMRGIDEYSDTNSFFYDNQDNEELENEGYFQSIQCPHCLERLKAQLEGDSMSKTEITNPELRPVENDYQVKSYKLNAEKYVNELWYRCNDHPEASIMKRETRYE